MGFIRKPSIKKSFKARTTGRIKRQIKKATTIGYGRKGKGFITNPGRSIKSAIYHKTTVGINPFSKAASGASASGSVSVNSSVKPIKYSPKIDYAEKYKLSYENLKSQNRRKQALSALIKVILVKFSGVKNTPLLNAIMFGGSANGNIQATAPGSTDYYVQELKKYSDIYNAEIGQDIYDKLNLPLNMCDKKLFIAQLEKMVAGTYSETECAPLLLNNYICFFNEITGGQVKVKQPKEKSIANKLLKYALCALAIYIIICMIYGIISVIIEEF